LAALQQEHSNAREVSVSAEHAILSLANPELVQGLQAMLLQLQAADMDAMSAMAELQLQFGEALGEDIAALEEAMADLDFDKALPLCQDLLRKCAGDGV
jgi:hypothetical protein